MGFYCKKIHVFVTMLTNKNSIKINYNGIGKNINTQAKVFFFFVIMK